MIQKILAFFASLFTRIPAESEQKLAIAPKTISHIPVFGEVSDAVKVYQAALVSAGQDPGPIDGQFFSLTKAATSRFQRSKGMEGSGYPGEQTIALLGLKVLGSVKDPEAPVIIPPAKSGTPWFDYAKTFSGKKETDPEFNKFMSSKWPLVGLRSGTIATSTWAWCGLFVAVSLAGVGLNYDKGGALAMAWRDFGQKIEWKTQGIPRAAIVQIEHEGKCDSDDNHVAFADGDCTAADLLKAGATINLYGGNQQNAAKVSTYPVRSICAVRWPQEFARPPRVMKSVNCTSGQSGQESTR